MQTRRILIIAGIILIFVVGYGVFVSAQDTTATANASSAEEYEIVSRVQVRQDSFVETVNGATVIEAARSVTLQFQSTAPIVEILAEEGDTVQAGDVIARVDSSSVDQRLSDAELQLALEQLDFDSVINPATPEQIAVAEANVEAARLSMGIGIPLTGANSIAAEIDALNAELQANLLWQSQLNRDLNPPNLDGAWMAVVFTEPDTEERQEALDNYNLLEAQIRLNDASFTNLESQVVVAQEVAQAEQQRPTTSGGSSSAQQQLTQAQINLSNLLDDPGIVQLSLAQIDLLLAELDVQYVEALLTQTQIIAPFDGILADMNLTVGEVPPTDAVRLIDTSSFELIVPVDEIDVVGVFEGQTVNVSLEALPSTVVTGTVTHVALTPVQRAGITTYDVRVLLDETDAPIRVGMTATARIVVDNIDSTLLVPVQYVQTTDLIRGNLLVVENAIGNLELRSVELGVRSSGVFQILSGVEEGETVILLSEDEFEQFVQEQLQSGELNEGA